VVGPSGCGKSTLLKAVGGYLTPTEGEIRLKGERITRPGPDRIMVFQEFDQLLPWMTVFENVTFPLKTTGTLRGKAATRGRCTISPRSSSPISPTAIRTRCPAA
jgi:NitT/TauT family transport system ATP-binding protein